MAEDTQIRDCDDIDERPADADPKTNGYIERTILHCMADRSDVADGSDESYAPATVGDVLDAIASVIERGDYANVGPKTATTGTVRKSTIRRALTQLREKNLVQRVEDLTESERTSDRFDLGTLRGDPDDVTNYARTSDDARVTDWILTDDGRHEIDRLDARYAAELDELAARYGRPRGETTDRIDA
ncbi:hypothetical protein [Halorussus amylolyticus]|uniref:hypothetical protein n=1 Tax=Halorussus amylolyticus TaxID=1126242 RepID=UPI00138F8F68|nr:hypothetical protein [Halorussus amylolyticus]